MVAAPTERKSLARNGADSWAEYRRLVIQELERINAVLIEIQKEIGIFRTEIALLKMKAGVWGVAAGAISGALVTLGAILLRSF